VLVEDEAQAQAQEHREQDEVWEVAQVPDAARQVADERELEEQGQEAEEEQLDGLRV
jgi:hypothetical protein